MKDDGSDRYRSDFAIWSDRIERLLKRGILMLVILLVIVQLVLQIPAARHLLTTTDHSEGVPFNYDAR